MTHDVAIVGAGFTGAALAIQLLRRLPQGARLVIIGTPHALGRGIAYGTECPDHLLNVRAGRMSAISDEPDNFVRWLKQNEPLSGLAVGDIGEEYLPRMTYGRYVRETLLKAVAAARGRVEIEIVEGTVVDINALEHGFSIRAANGRRFAASAVALCLGNGSADFPLRAEAIDPAAQDFMIREPFADYRVGTIANDATVLLVGTGLTMVDQVLALTRAGHTGPITAISRHGLLPLPHLERRTDPKAIPLPDGEVRLGRLVAAVVAAARREVASGGDWRAVVDGLRPETQDLWQRLSLSDQRRFHRHASSFWSIHRHRMAPAVADRIAAMRDTGQLRIRSGRIVAVRHAARGLVVAFRQRGSKTVELLPFDWALNCSGTGKETMADPLVARMLAAGLVRHDALAQTMAVNADSVLLDRNGVETRGLFALGTLTRGRFLEVVAVPEIREQSAAVAESIARRVREAGASVATASRRGGEFP